MAAGDHTITNGFPTRVGNLWMLCGTLEADDTLRGFAICNTQSHIISAEVKPNTDVQYCRVVINNNGSDDTEGSIAVDASAAATCDYTIHYI